MKLIFSSGAKLFIMGFWESTLPSPSTVLQRCRNKCISSLIYWEIRVKSWLPFQRKRVGSCTQCPWGLHWLLSNNLSIDALMDNYLVYNVSVWSTCTFTHSSIGRTIHPSIGRNPYSPPSHHTSLVWDKPYLSILWKTLPSPSIQKTLLFAFLSHISLQALAERVLF